MVKQDKTHISPFGKHHGPHQDQMRVVDHRHIRKEVRQDNRNWEGKYSA